MKPVCRILAMVLVAVVLSASYKAWLAPPDRAIPWIRPPTPTPNATEGAAPGVTIADVKEAIESFNIHMVDARGREKFAEGHIPSAVHIPFEEADRDTSLIQDEFIQQDDIIVYCTGEGCDESHRLAELLRELGFTKVREYSEGMDGWEAAGERIEIP